MLHFRDVTPDDATRLAHVLGSAGEAAFRGRVPDRCLDFSEAESAANWAHFFADGLPAGDCMIACLDDNGAFVGYAWGGPSDKETEYGGELRQISVSPTHQGQGIGRALVRRVAGGWRRRASTACASKCCTSTRTAPSTSASAENLCATTLTTGKA